MSIFFCVECEALRDSDVDGCMFNPNDPSLETCVCDECESKYHEEEFKESMDQFRKMAKMGEL